MNTKEKALVIVGVIGVMGAWAAWQSAHEKISTTDIGPVMFTQKLSLSDRKVVNGNLQKAFDTAKPKADVRAKTEESHNPALVSEIRERGSIARFRDLELCLESRNPCDVPQTEPRSSDIYVSDTAVRELQGLRMAFSQLSAQDQSTVRADLAPTTKWALENYDDNVREEGLYLARIVLPPNELVPSVIASLQESVSAPLYDVGLSILREHKDINRQEQEDFYVQTMESGGFYASEEVARQILPYLNKSNIKRFNELRTKLPADSNTASYLGANIKEFRMIEQGG